LSRSAWPTCRESRPRLRPAVLGAALGLHVGLLAALALASYLDVPPIDEPPIEVTFLGSAPPPPPPAGPASMHQAAEVAATEGGEGWTAESAESARIESTAFPETAVEPDGATSAALVDDWLEIPGQDAEEGKEATREDVAGGPTESGIEGDLGGEWNRVPGGVPGGIPGGIPGGVPGGTPGGVLGATGGHAPYRSGGDVSAPVVLSRVRPIYPPTALHARIEGVVKLEAVIRSDGKVGQVRVLHGLGLGCTDAAIQALRRWRFLPGERNGVPVDVFFELTVDFKLN